VEDYLTGFRRLAGFADFVVVNVSSPNTPGLRLLQGRDQLQPLLGALIAESRTAAHVGDTTPVPIFVKISPDMAEADLEDVVAVALDLDLAGIVATNTTISREGVAAGVEQSGGLSGKPLRDRASEVMRILFRCSHGKLPLIGNGGIFTAEDVYARFQAGASLVQLYTGMIYEGPFLARRINDGLLRLMERDGVKQISELIGTAT